MLSLSLEDDLTRPFSRSIDEAGRRLIDAATVSLSVSEFLEQAATILLEQLTLKGVAVWLMGPQGGPPELMGASGDVRALRERAVAPHPLATPRSWTPSDVAVETFQLSSRSQIRVEALFSRDDARDQPSTGWLSRVLGPAVQLLDVLTQAREAASLRDVLTAGAMDAIVGLDRAGRCRLWNDAAEELFGWPQADVLNQPLRIIPQASERTWRECLDRVLQAGLSESLTVTAQRWDGTAIDVELRILPLGRDHATLPSVLLYIRDQTPLHQAATWRAISTAVARAAHAGSGEPGPVAECLAVLRSLGQFDRATIWLLNPESRQWTLRTAGRCVDESAPRLSSATQTALAQLMAEQSVDLVGPFPSGSPAGDRRSLPGSAVLGVPLPDGRAAIILEYSDGRSISMAARESLRGIAAVIGVALQQEQLQATSSQLRQRVVQAEKLEALGLLTTTVAHDLNNILTIIFGYADLAKDASSSHGHLDEIEKAAAAAAQLTRQLLSSSRASRNAMTAFDLAVAFGETAPLLRSLVGPGITLQIDPAPGRTLHVRMPRSDFDQLVLNLVANARDAMPQGGTIRCQLDSCEPSLRDLKGNSRLQSSRCVRLRVIDSGCGIPDDVRERMFQPFFTTKEPGQGTGVGLATVRQIVDRAAGGITVESSPGVGTVFTVLLPQTVSDLCPRSVEGPARLDPRGTESVLIAHEDRRIEELLTRILSLKGYRVRGLSLQPNGASFPREEHELLVIDAASLGRLRGAPEHSASSLPQRLLVISDLETDPGDLATGFFAVRLLAKPFSSQQLAIAVRDALDAPRAGLQANQRPRMLSKRLATESEQVRHSPPTA